MAKLSNRAALLCKDANFRIWLDRARSSKYGMNIEDGTHTEDDARQFLLDACEIKSRSELDNNQGAAAMFVKIEQAHWRYWQRKKKLDRGLSV